MEGATKLRRLAEISVFLAQDSHVRLAALCSTMFRFKNSSLRQFGIPVIHALLASERFREIPPDSSKRHNGLHSAMIQSRSCERVVLSLEREDDT